MPENIIICIGCPLGCHVKLTVSANGKIEKITGNQCKEGKKYITSEFQNPIRVLTATVLTEGGGRLLSVRTDKPVFKNQLSDMMRTIAKIRVEPPVKLGQVIIKDILGSGANLVSTSIL